MHLHDCVYIYTWCLCFKRKKFCPKQHTLPEHASLHDTATAFECVLMECQSLSIAQWKLIFFLLKNMLSLTLSFKCIDYRRIIEIFRIYFIPWTGKYVTWTVRNSWHLLRYNLQKKSSNLMTHFVTIFINQVTHT